jgi:hypothetical protein
MPAALPKKRFLGLGAALVTALMWFVCESASTNIAAQGRKESAWKEFKFLGADTCKQCHAAPLGNATDFVQLNEYTVWQTEDRHAMAYAVLEGPRGKQMGKLLADDEKFVLKPKAGCLNCHGMHFPGREGEGFHIKDGVGCDGCHGPSENWLTPHFAQKLAWRKKTAQEKFDLGMRNLRDPAIRAELCMSCHLGNAREGKVVTHAMFAAGHPPLLSIEVGTFSKNMPQHWWDLKEVPYLQDLQKATKGDREAKKKLAEYKIKDVGEARKILESYQYGTAECANARLALIGGGIAFRDQMKLITARSDAKGKQHLKNWPELALPTFAGEKAVQPLWPQLAMATSDCGACHHELKVPSWRQQRGYGLCLIDGSRIPLAPGRPPIRNWPISLFEVGLQWLAENDKDGKNRVGQLKGRLGPLYATCNSRPFGDMGKVHRSAEAVWRWAVPLVDRKFVAARWDRSRMLQLLRHLCQLPARSDLDFESARQLAMAIDVVYGEWSSKEGPKNQEEIRRLLAGLQKDLSILTRDDTKKLRQQLIKEDLEKLTKQKISTQEQLQQAMVNVKPGQLRETLLSPKFLKAFQEIRNKDYQTISRKASRYDPEQFKKHLRELSKLLPRK